MAPTNADVLFLCVSCKGEKPELPLRQCRGEEVLGELQEFLEGDGFKLVEIILNGEPSRVAHGHIPKINRLILIGPKW